MWDLAYKKLFRLRDKLKEENKNKVFMEKTDRKTEFLAKTIDHM